MGYKFTLDGRYRVVKKHGQFKQGDMVTVLFADDTFAVVRDEDGRRVAVPVETVTPPTVIGGAGEYLTRSGERARVTLDDEPFQDFVWHVEIGDRFVKVRCDGRVMVSEEHNDDVVHYLNEPPAVKPDPMRDVAGLIRNLQHRVESLESEVAELRAVVGPQRIAVDANGKPMVGGDK